MMSVTAPENKVEIRIGIGVEIEIGLRMGFVFLCVINIPVREWLIVRAIATEVAPVGKAGARLPSCILPMGPSFPSNKQQATNHNIPVAW